jgi:hypothetical protein
MPTVLLCSGVLCLRLLSKVGTRGAKGETERGCRVMIRLVGEEIDGRVKEMSELSLLCGLTEPSIVSGTQECGDGR